MMFQFNENVCPSSKCCISEQNSMTNDYRTFPAETGVTSVEYSLQCLFLNAFISCKLIQFSYYQAVSEPTSCLIKYTIIKVGRLVIIFAESTIKLYTGVCNCLTIKIFIWIHENMYFLSCCNNIYLCARQNKV